MQPARAHGLELGRVVLGAEVLDLLAGDLLDVAQQVGEDGAVDGRVLDGDVGEDEGVRVEAGQPAERAGSSGVYSAIQMRGP